MARPKRLIHCAECGRNRLHKAKGLCKQCYGRQYHAEHLEEWCEYSCQWREANPDKAREIDRRWREAHPEERREHHRQYREAHLEEAREYDRQWCKTHPEEKCEIENRRRARKLDATIGPVDVAAIYARDKVCIYCGATEDLTLDHLIPLTREGPHCQDNLAVACRPCNSSKGTKTYDEFVKEANDEYRR